MIRRARALRLAAAFALLAATACTREAPSGAPPLVASQPAAGETGVAPTSWVRLRFAGPVSFNARRSVALSCDGSRLAASVHQLEPGVLAVDPEGDLPSATQCSVLWEGRGGQGGGETSRVAFETAPDSPRPTVVYDRFDPEQRSPFPDDFWLRRERDVVDVPRLTIDFREFSEPSQLFVDALLAGTKDLDGFSPIAHLTVELEEAPDPASLPRSSAESLDPAASVGLFDLTPGSPRYGERVPFRLEARTASSWGSTTHDLLIFPTGSLEPGGRYGLVVTRRMRTLDGRPFEPSPFFRVVRDGIPTPTYRRRLSRVRRLSGEVLDAIGTIARPPIAREDVALAIRFTVRTIDAIPEDALALKEDVLAAPPPRVRVETVVPETAEAVRRGSQVAAIVRGTWEAPDWRERGMLARDASGRPRRMLTHDVPFVLALPIAARDAPVPVTMYQHGNPGSAEEVVEHARLSLARAGLAVIGFTDPLNREVSPERGLEERMHDQVFDILWRTTLTKRIPDYFIQTTGEQHAFLRAIEELAKRGRFELPGAGPPLHGIDPDQPITYVGVSEGANHGVAFLSSAPEIRAAVLVTGGRRFSEVLMHQMPYTFLAPLYRLGFEEFTPTDMWVVLALFQTAFDAQDPHNYAPFVYRAPLEVAGTTRKASILLVEGVGDALVPNHVTESLGRTLGPVPQVAPVVRRVPFLDVARAPLAANVDARTTAGLAQYAPVGEGVAPTPGCLSPPLSERGSRDAHVCAQNAAESLRQRVVFLTSALREKAPRIIDPLASEELAN